MTIAATLVGSNELLSTAATATVSGTTNNGATWVVFAADTVGWGATPITDNKSNTYIQIGTNVSVFGVTGTLWYKNNGNGGSGHIFTATPSSADLVSLIVVEITGGAVSGILDQSATGNDDVASPFTSSVTGTTTQANEIVLAFEFDNRSAATGITWGNGYTSLVDLSNNSGITSAAAKLNITSVGTQQSSFTNANTTEAVTWIATFKEAGAGMSRRPPNGPGVSPDRLQQFTPAKRNNVPPTLSSTGTLAVQEGGDSLSAQGFTPIIVGNVPRFGPGLNSPYNINQFVRASRNNSTTLVTITGTFGVTGANDTLVASGTTTIVGTLSKTNINDTLAATGNTTVTGTFTRININDTLSSSGTTTIVGTFNKTNLDDTVTSSGSVGGGVTGSVNATNGNDGVSASGTTTIVAIFSKTELPDSLSSTGTTTIVGTLGKTNINDSLSASGFPGSPPTVTTYLALTSAGK